MTADDLTPRDTAGAIARVRAEEAKLPAGQRLFEDPYAKHFDDEHAQVQRVFDSVPFFREQVRLRTRYLDDCVRRAISAGTRQLVLLGAGFDMRALRLPEIRQSRTKVVEVDHLAQLDDKQERLAALEIAPPSFVCYAAADLMGPETDIELALQGAGIEPGQRVLWLAEGLIGYLSAEAVTRVGTAAGRYCAAGSEFVANYFAALYSVERLADLLGPGGWTVTGGPTFADLHREFIGPDVPPGSDAFGFMRAVK